MQDSMDRQVRGMGRNCLALLSRLPPDHPQRDRDIAPIGGIIGDKRQHVGRFVLAAELMVQLSKAGIARKQDRN